MAAAPLVPDLIRHRRPALLVGGIILLLAGSWLAGGVYGEIVQTREVEQAAPWIERASYTYSVPVTRNSTHWPIGSRLPMGEPAYFRTISDSIDVTFDWVALAPDDVRSVAVATMIVQARAQTADGRPYWSVEHTLAEAVVEDARAGLHLVGTVDLDALVAEVAALAEELPPGEGIINWSVRARVGYAMEIADRHDQGQPEYVLPIQASDPRFVLPGPDDLHWEPTHAQENVRVTTAPVGMRGILSSWTTLSLLLAGLVAFALGALVAPTAGNGAFDREYRKYREWVSVAGAIPPTARSTNALVDVGSLEDLVHVAADARTRVLLDSGTREFYALLPGVTYRYARHATTPPSG